MKTIKRVQKVVSRRKFIKSGMVVGAGVLVSSAACNNDSRQDSKDCSCPDAGSEPTRCQDAGHVSSADAGVVDNTTTADAEVEVEEGMLIEPQKKIPIMAEAEVVVVGGGPSGIGAALSAARNGASTILIDQLNGLGGAQTHNVNPIFSFIDPQIHGGVVMEILDLLEKGGAIKNLNDLPESEWSRMMPRITAVVPQDQIPKRMLETKEGYWGPWGRTFDVEYYKHLLENIMQEAKVKLIYHATAVGAIRDGNTLKGVVLECEEGRQAVMGKIIIDTTGQADIVWKSGAPCIAEEGNTPDPPYTTLPGGALNSAFIAGVDVNKFIQYKEADPAEWGGMYGGRALIEQAREEGYKDLDRDLAILTPVQDVYNTGRIWVMYPVAGWDAENTSYTEKLTAVQISLRRQIWGLHKLLKDKVPGFENSFIDKTSFMPAVGGGAWHRMEGEYVLAVEDLRQGNPYSDSVCIGNMPPDVFEASGSFSYNVLPYDIPYRCLVSKGIDNLMAAGASMSSGDVAVMGTRYCTPSICTGQAAGTAAALAVKNNVLPKNLDIKLLQDTLRSQGVVVTVQDVSDEAMEPYKFIQDLDLTFTKDGDSQS